MIKRKISPAEVIDLLNELLKIDRKSIECLFGIGIPCNKKLAKHPSVQVGKFADRYFVRIIGILNGMFGADKAGWGCLSIDITKNGRIKQFKLLKERLTKHPIMNKPKGKFLLIGSAPYIKDWYKKYGHALIRKGFKLCAINNAWAIDPDNISLWMYPCDFFDTGHLFPDKKQRKKWKEYVCDHRVPTKGKCEYIKEGSGTILLNALVYLLNQHIDKGFEVLIAGSDCVYKKEESHFYGKGAADPLRYGEAWLVKELERIKSFYGKEGCVVYNVGGRRETLLPFKRKRPKEMISNRGRL